MYKKIFFSFLTSLLIVLSLRQSALYFMDVKAFTWLNNLNQSSLTPPGYVFGIAWSIIYCLMIASITNLLFNINITEYFKLFIHLFPYLFFHSFLAYSFYFLQNTIYGFIVITLLTMSLLNLILFIKKISNFSYLLLLPQLIWLFFATYLSFEIMRLN